VGWEMVILSLLEYGWILVFIQPLIWGTPNKCLMIVFNISKMSKCLISLNLLEKKKRGLNAIVFKKNLKKISRKS